MNCYTKLQRRMSNAPNIAPLDFSGLGPIPVLVRSQNNDPLYRPEPDPIGAPPRLIRSTNLHEAQTLPQIWTPPPARQAEEPPRLTRETGRVTLENIQSVARRLF